MISVDHLSMNYGPKLLFAEACLQLSKGHRYGIVGANGSGKTTFLKLLMGEEEAAEGNIAIAKGSRIGWLKQDQHKYEKVPLIKVVLQGREALWKAFKEKDFLISQPSLSEKSNYRLSELEDIIADEDGYRAEALAEALLVGLGIPEIYHEKPMSFLSGGMKLRVLLAQTLFNDPNILLLDEPTNYLDISSIAWLEKYVLDTFKGLLVFISHDQDFLNHLATDIFDLDYSEIRHYVGNYDQFLIQKQGTMEQKLREKDYLEKKVATLRSFVERFRYKPSKSRQAMSREKMIDKIEMPNVESSSRQTPHFQFKFKARSALKVLTVEDIAKIFGDKTVLEGVTFQVQKHDKIAILGRNGRGKSTLLKILVGQLEADLGHYQWGQNTSFSYFAQNLRDSIDVTDQSIVNWLMESSRIGDWNVIYKALGQMLFHKDDFNKPLSALSGGEMTRLLFAKMVLDQRNVLLLDEPTNHLDIEARGSLAKALKKFEGTLLFVSHDRHFVQQVANKLLILKEDRILFFDGNYDEFLAKEGMEGLLAV
ncbi:MAG: ABC-F family ATP-binding cassette domain-containing protein [Parachlamydiales bacterium]|nr:ABC-F family ATP-binding cassette domain-containing protein [Parachlamydiales bacterium]